MKTTYLPLVELSSLTMAAALVLVPRWMAMTYLELDGAPATLIGITCLGIAFAALIIWLKRVGNTVTSIFDHPDLGKVQIHGDCWGAKVSFPTWPTPLNIIDTTDRPTAAQMATLQGIKDQFPAFLTASAQAVQDLVKPASLIIRVSDLVPESIGLDDGRFGNFSITFSAPRHERRLKWGVSVEFVNGKVDFAEALH